MKKKYISSMIISTLILGNLILWPVLLINAGVISIQDEKDSIQTLDAKPSFDMEKILAKYTKPLKDQITSIEDKESDSNSPSPEVFEVIEIK
ncbi:hypothetical protein [Peribacillus alkalitolerans]|uniref:hypothetical protein n=1 Tax=Peribacillus alkalitolerans TaxID=1550385 RepID=UPI0013D2D772|nr:hypothetical protein [Peribacillus alkalitolerans]